MTIAPEMLEELLGDHDAVIEDAYNTALALSLLCCEEGSRKISLEIIPNAELEQRLTDLKAKLAFYDQKVHEYLSENPGRINLTGSVSRGYKRFALKLLLERGSVDTWALSRAFMIVEGTVDQWRYNNACGVIEDYMTTGGANTVGGSGLKAS